MIVQLSNCRGSNLIGLRVKGGLRVEKYPIYPLIQTYIHMQKYCWQVFSQALLETSHTYTD